MRCRSVSCLTSLVDKLSLLRTVIAHGILSEQTAAASGPHSHRFVLFVVE